MSRHYSEGLPWEKTPYRAARVNLSKIPAQRWTQKLRDEFPKLLKGKVFNFDHKLPCIILQIVNLL